MNSPRTEHLLRLEHMWAEGPDGLPAHVCRWCGRTLAQITGAAADTDPLGCPESPGHLTLGELLRLEKVRSR